MKWVDDRGTIGNWMHGPTVWIAPEASVADALARLAFHRVSCLAVCEADERPVGVVSRTDLLRLGHAATEAELDGLSVDSVMTRQVLTVGPSTSVACACATLVEEHVHRLFVEREGRLIGVFSTRDAMNALADLGPVSALRDYMSAPVRTVGVDSPYAEAVEILSAEKITGLVVVEGEAPVGVFTQREVLETRELAHEAPVGEAMSPSLLCLQADSPLYRAAALAATTRARRVVAMEGARMEGLLTGMDFTRALRDFARS